MEKFLSGYTGPPAKKPKSDTKAKKKADSDKPLEVRKFNESWRWNGGKKRDWLEYHPQTKTMRCNLCTKFSSSSESVFVSGQPALKLDTIKAHEESKLHLKCVQIDIAQKNPEKTDGERVKRSLNAKHRQKMALLFRNAHALQEASWLA